MKRMIHTMLLAALLLSMACSNKSSSSDCGAGELYTQNGATYCVYQKSIIEEGFLCPAFLPYDHQFGAFLICSNDGQLPLDFSYDADVVNGGDTQQSDLTAGDTTQLADTSGDVTADTNGDTVSGDVESSKHNFSVTIKNNRATAIFVDGLALPFGLSQNGNGLGLYGVCDCSRCGSGNPCAYGEPAPIAVIIPAGESVTVTTNLNWYTTQSVTTESCPEVASWVGFCDVPHTFESGDYRIVVRYDDTAAITAQGLEATENQMWGQTVWTQPLVSIGSVSLSKTVSQSFTLQSDASTSLTLTIEEPTPCGDSTCTSDQVCIVNIGGAAVDPYDGCEPLPVACADKKDDCNCLVDNNVCPGASCDENGRAVCPRP
ncbi:MAG: hypothetical protein KC609_05590 [Myxococcales bacterium]|nr:hypothetical protein [Myxococcales bacterium]